MADRYQGYANHETWSLALWINNEQGFQETILDMARESIKNHEKAYEFAETLKEYIDDMWEDFFDDPATYTSYGLFIKDVGSLWRVDWFELAEEFITDAMES